jgi:hypothetical protein
MLLVAFVVKMSKDSGCGAETAPTIDLDLKGRSLRWFSPFPSMPRGGKMQDDASYKQCQVMVNLAKALAAGDPELTKAYEL